MSGHVSSQKEIITPGILIFTLLAKIQIFDLIFIITI